VLAAGQAEGVPMSCEHLICAQCAGPVVEGRCPACRAARDHVHHQHSFISPQVIIAAILALIFVLLLAVHFAH
jgi:ferredoxin